MSATQPVRYPDARNRSVMTRRAWTLVGLNVLIPGSAQVLAGDRRLGRFGLGATLVLWTLAVLLGLVAIVRREWILTLATNSWALGAGVLVLAFYAVLWVILTLDTLRLVRFVKVAPGARAPLALLSLVVLGALVGGSAFAGTRAVSAIGVLQTVFGGGATFADPIDGRYNILLLGGDAGPDRDGLRPDSTSVVSIDAETGESVIFGIPRDLLDAPFPADSPMAALYPNGYGYDDVCNVDVCQFNSIYTEVEVNSPELYPDAAAQGSSPGIEATRDAAEGVTGLTIPYYVLIDMEGFSQLIDALGGVDVTVTERVPIIFDLDDDGNLTGDGEWIEPGRHHFNGYYALWYARARHGTSDYDRMARQKQIEEAMLVQMDPANVLLHFNEVAAAGADVVRTDIPSSLLGHLVELGLRAKQLAEPVTTVDFVPPDWSPEYPDFAAIQAQVQSLVGPPPTESPAPQG
ncbi:MAG: LCP family protein [Actinomycetales bacterium]|nr:LCP family protein [Actinomycetales bacterium]